MIKKFKIIGVITLFLSTFFATNCEIFAQTLLSESQLSSSKEYTSLEAALLEPNKVVKLSLTIVQNLPADVAKLPNLQVLIISGTKIDLKQVISQVSGLPIQELYLRESELSVLPAEITKLSNLKQLDLSFNKYTSLPAEMSQLSKLQTLNLLENKFADAEKDKVKKMLPNTKILF